MRRFVEGVDRDSWRSESTGRTALTTTLASAVALLSIKFLLAFVRTHTFIPFGIYRIVAALAFALLVM